MKYSKIQVDLNSTDLPLLFVKYHDFAESKYHDFVRSTIHPQGGKWACIQRKNRVYWKHARKQPEWCTSIYLDNFAKKVKIILSYRNMKYF